MTRGQGVGGGEPSGRAALAAGLRRLKEKSGPSFGRLADRTHYSRSSWERFLNGKQLPTAATLEECATATATDADADVLRGLPEEALKRTDSAGPAGQPGVVQPGPAHDGADAAGSQHYSRIRPAHGEHARMESRGFSHGRGRVIRNCVASPAISGSYQQ
ncbi:helix-turn-helix domain-containing protein [Streptomyces sp. NPDC005070]